MPLRGLIGSDVLAHRPDWKVVDNPFGNNDPIVLLPALKPDVALFHAPMADRYGNVFIGTQRELSPWRMPREDHRHRRETARRRSACAIRRSPPARLPGFYVEAVAVEPRGAWPLPLPDHYGIDAAHMTEYAQLAATAEGFADYLDRYVHERRAA